jgi:outer membrane protein assembly factor BamB
MVKADGEISTLTRAGSRLVLSGDFHHIGPYVGSGVALDTRSGARDAAFARFDGQVSDVISDGHGGWYVAGQFRLAGSAPRSVAHVLASGALDPKFAATLTGFATSLALVGSRLYVGRWFGTDVVALDAVTGARDTGFRADGLAEVTELLVAGDVIYAGTTDGVGAFSLATGQRDTAFACRCGDRVMALAASGDRLYIGFRSRGIEARNIATGSPIDTFAPSPNTVTGSVEDQGPMVMLVDGDRLIVGGRGMRIGGPSSNLAALDLTTGAADPNFGARFANPIHDLVVDGDSLLVAGAPRSGRPAPVLRVDRATGAYQDALVPKLDGSIDALAVDGRKLFVGGRFATANAVRTDGVAEVDARTGVLVPGFAVRARPHDDQFGEQVLVSDGSLVFGRTTFANGRGSVARAVAFSARTGAPKRAFTPHGISFPGGGYTQNAIWAAAHGRVYVAHPNVVNRTIWPLSGVDVLSLHSGERIAHYDLPYDGYVEDMEPHGSQLIVSGSFRRFWSDGRPRHLATMAVDPLTGTINDTFDAHTNGPVVSIDDYADRLFLSGYYDHAYGLRRPGFASVYDNTGAINAGFNRRIGYAFGISDGLLEIQGSSNLIAVDPYKGKRVLTIPQITPGFRGNGFVLAPGGAYVTATLDLPYDQYPSLYDDYAVFVPPAAARAS